MTTARMKNVVLKIISVTMLLQASPLVAESLPPQPSAWSRFVALCKGLVAKTPFGREPSADEPLQPSPKPYSALNRQEASSVLAQRSPLLLGLVKSMQEDGASPAEIQRQIETIREDMEQLSRPSAVNERIEEFRAEVAALDVDQINRWIMEKNLYELNEAFKFIDADIDTPDSEYFRLYQLDIDWEDLEFIVADGGDLAHRSQPIWDMERLVRINFLNRLWKIFGFFKMDEDDNVSFAHIPEASNLSVEEAERIFSLAQAVLVGLEQLRNRPQGLPPGRSGSNPLRLPQGRDSSSP